MIASKDSDVLLNQIGQAGVGAIMKFNAWNNQ